MCEESLLYVYNVIEFDKRQEKITEIILKIDPQQTGVADFAELTESNSNKFVIYIFFFFHPLLLLRIARAISLA
jgi:hypothetical protein